MLIDLGYYMGSDLNRHNDNSWVTLIFRRPRWFARNVSANPARILKGWQILEKAMMGRLGARADEWAFLVRAALEYASQRLWPKLPLWLSLRRGMPWVARRLWALARSGSMDLSGYVGWGWKEPTTQFYLPYLCECFRDLKYIQVVRHGLDMAYRGKQRQLHNWGGIFGIEVPDSRGPLPRVMLDFWVKINRSVISLGEKRLSERFLVVRLDRLYASPRTEVDRLLAFLGLDAVSEDVVGRLYAMPKKPASSERYKREDLSIFSEGEIEAVRELGFEVEL